MIALKTLKTIPLDEPLLIKLGQCMAPWIKSGDRVALSGTLGAGKTTFVRALIHALVATDIPVPSPTYTLLQEYDTPKGPLFHYDFYRLEDPEEAWELGLETASQGITMMEWPEKIAAYTPAEMLYIRFETKDDCRVLTLTPPQHMSLPRWQDLEQQTKDFLLRAAL